jgi:hypothetical protein
MILWNFYELTLQYLILTILNHHSCLQYKSFSFLRILVSSLNSRKHFISKSSSILKSIRKL